MNSLTDTSQKEELANLLLEIKSYNLKEVKLTNISSGHKELTQNNFLQILKKIHKENKYVIVDVRSEKEYEKNSIPYSVNLPILNNIERHKVGLLYAKHSKEKALSLAYYFAEQKELQFIDAIKNKSQNKTIIIYCWRGGERSKYVANLLQKNNIEVLRLQGGQKGFRKSVFNFLYNKSIPIISLSGLTGCGKSEILDYIQKNYPRFPVLHLENCASHASSVFGKIRFNLRGETTKNQQQFESNIFSELLPHIDENDNLPVFLSENESKKIGKLIIPPAVLNGLQKGNHICITCPMGKRIERLTADYFGRGNSSTNLKISAKENVKEQLQFLSKKLSKEKIKEYIEWIDREDYYNFFKDIMENYYDNIYKKPENDALCTIDNSGIGSTVNSIFKYWEQKVLSGNLFF